MMRSVGRWVLVLATACLGACQSPCGRVASAICTIPGEQGSCTFLKGLASDNEPAQNACKELKGAADAYALEPDSTLQKAKWTIASGALHVFGWAGEVTKTTKSAADSAKDAAATAADDAKEAAAAAADKASEAAKEAAKAAQGIGDALRGK